MTRRFMRPAICLALSTAILMLGNATMAQEALPVDPESGDTAGPDAPEPTPLGFFSHGYFRLGVGSTDGDEFVAFLLNGAGSKYRLGNESDEYGEFSIGYRAALANGSSIIAEVMGNGWFDSNALNFGAPMNSDTTFAQAYAGIERMGDGALVEAFLWGGRRYYRRRDVHMSDFYYENLSGDGIGLENVDLGPAHLSTALFYYDTDQHDLDIGYHTTTLDVRLHDISLGGSWLGEIGLAYLDGNEVETGGGDGYQVRLHAWNTELGWGEWANALMYGQGTGIGFDSVGNPNLSWDDNRWRFVTQALFIASDDLQTQATGVWQRTEIDGAAETWLSAGIRPQYNITDWVGIAVELGYDQVIPEDEDPMSLAKLTIAPFISFGRTGYFARPQLRAFVTWADWSDEGAITQQAAFGSATQGRTVGIQLEQWW